MELGLKTLPKPKERTGKTSASPPDRQETPKSDTGGILWQATREGCGTVTLFGVLHFGTADMYPLAQTVGDAFQQAQRLIFETELDKLTGEQQLAMADVGTQPPGKCLADQLSPEIWNRLRETAGSLGVDSSQLTTMQPWYCAATLTNLALTSMDLTSELGVDRWLFQQAGNCQKARDWFETAEEQIDMLSQVYPNHANRLIQHLLTDIHDLPHFTGQTLKAWLTGDRITLEHLLRKGFENERELEDRLLHERNSRWLPKINELSRQREAVMVVVGVGHLLGNRSLPALLAQQGYRLDCLSTPV